MGQSEQITVHVKYRSIEQMFTGNVDDVWVSVNRFFSEMIPTFDLASKMTLTVDLKNLIQDFKDLIAIAPEGPQLVIQRQKLTDSETLLLNFLAAYMGHKLGKLNREWLTRDELQAKLGKSMKITGTRLGELIREEVALKTDEGNYRITTRGIKQLQQEMLPRIRMKIRNL